MANNDPNDIPVWHKEILANRLKNIREGKAKFHNWNDIKKLIFKDKDFNNGKISKN